jgi:hypothetical protein
VRETRLGSSEYDAWMLPRMRFSGARSVICSASATGLRTVTAPSPIS